MKAPTTAQLIEAVRERMEAAIERPVSGFEARVVRNVLAIVERELAHGADVDELRQRTLASFEADGDETLAADIRAGRHDDVEPELRAHLLALAEAQLAIDNPRWLA